MRRRRCYGLAAILLLFLACATACERHKREASPPARPKDRLTTALLSDPKTFNPILVTDATSGEILEPIFDGLVRIDPKSTLPEPSLAEGWTVSDEGRTWTFDLRRGVRWHDGHPFTARDVAFTMRAIFDETVPNSSRYSLTVGGVAPEVRILDDFRVEFRMPHAFAPFLYAIAVPILPAHLLEKSLDEGRFTREWGIDTPPEKLVGTGPWKMTRFESSQVIEFTRNDDYWRRDADGRSLPYLPRRTMLIVKELNTAALKFRAGHTHYYEARPGEVAHLEDDAETLGIQVRNLGVETSNQFVVFNRNPRHWAKVGKNGQPDPRLRWFTDPAFLRALAHTVDKRGMVDTIYFGLGQPSVSEISSANHVFHNPKLRDYEYDPEKARRMLEEAGYRDRDGDGIREDSDGHPVRFGLTTNAGNTLRERLSSILLQDWRALGLDVHYRPQTFQALVERLNVTHEFDAVLIGFTAGIEPNNGANFLRSSGNLHIWNPAQEKPATAWEAEIDQLLDAGAAALELEKRQAAYFRIQEILHEQLPFIGTVRQQVVWAWSDDLENFHPLVWGLWHPSQIDIAP